MKLLYHGLWGPTVFIFYALWYRFKKAEGVLIAVNAAVIVAAGIDNPGQIILALTFSTLTLGQLYAFNDIYDAKRDANDPDKSTGFWSAILPKRDSFLIAIIFWALVLVVTGFSFDFRLGWYCLLMIFINTLYSTLFKGVPIVDIIWVALWGGWFVLLSLVEPRVELLLVIGLMTAISHIWQTFRDLLSDLQNKISTVAVFSKPLAFFILGVLCALLAYVVGLLTNILFAGLCFLPIIIYIFIREAKKVWIISKAIFAIIFVKVLISLYAS